MSGGTDLDRHLEAYLAIRDALGLAAGARPRLLRSFLDHARGATPPGTPIRAATALTWAYDHALPGCGLAGKAHRLTLARGFLAYLSAVVPGTEIPAHGLLAAPRRQRPYVFSDAEIEGLMAAAAKAPPRGTLRPVMLPVLLGLLASTGLRIGEAVRLRVDDLRLEAGPPHLRILQTKFQKSRLVPLHPTAAAELAVYLHRRQALGYHALSDAMFVAERGGPLDVGLLGVWFGKLTRKLGLWPANTEARRPSLHSFRHSFAIRRLRAWHEAGQDVQALLPTLSVYSADFTKTRPGDNRNLDLRREFMARADRAPIQVTSVLNGAFMDMLGAEMPIIQPRIHRVLHWGSADQPLDFTTKDDVAAYVAAVALDKATPRVLRIAGDSVSARGIAAIMSDATGARYRALWAGSIGSLGVLIRLAKIVAPQPRAAFPPWQSMQYMRDMFSGRGKLHPLDNDRYPDLRWTSAREQLAAGLPSALPKRTN